MEVIIFSYTGDNIGYAKADSCYDDESKEVVSTYEDDASQCLG
jgi:hypothetical protein